jgi:hypothetical protein
MIAVLIAIVLAAVAYWVCIALGLPWIVAVLAAVLVLLAGVSQYDRTLVVAPSPAPSAAPSLTRRAVHSTAEGQTPTGPRAGTAQPRTSSARR